MTAVLPLMKSVITPLAKSVFIPLGLPAGMSASDAAIQKKTFGSGRPPDLALRTISNEEMEDIIKIVNSLEKSGLLIKGISETIENEAKEQKGRFLLVLLGTLAASILGNALKGKEVTRAGERLIRVRLNF